MARSYKMRGLYLVHGKNPIAVGIGSVALLSIACCLHGETAPARFATESYLLLGHDRSAVDARRTFYAGAGVTRFRLRLRLFGEDSWPAGLIVRLRAGEGELEQLRGWRHVPASRRSGGAFWTPWIDGDRVDLEVDSNGAAIELGALGSYLAIVSLERIGAPQADSGATPARPIELLPGSRVESLFAAAGEVHRFTSIAPSGDVAPRYRVYVRPRREAAGHRIEPELAAAGDVADGERRYRPQGTDTGIYRELTAAAARGLDFTVRARTPGSYSLEIELASPPLVPIDAYLEDFDPARRVPVARAGKGRAPAGDWARFSDPSRLDHRVYIAAEGSARERLAQALAVASGHLLADPGVAARLGRVVVHDRPSGFRPASGHGGPDLGPSLGVLVLPPRTLEDPVTGGRRLARTLRRAVDAAGGSNRGPALASLPASDPPILGTAAPAREGTPAGLRAGAGAPIPGHYQDVLCALEALLELELAD